MALVVTACPLQSGDVALLQNPRFWGAADLLRWVGLGAIFGLVISVCFLFFARTQLKHATIYTTHRPDRDA